MVDDVNGSAGDPPRLHDHPVAGVEREGAVIVVRLAGELDLYNAATLRESLVEICGEELERLVVDLKAVEFVDSTALGVLIEARSRMANKHAFLLAAPTRETTRALQISGLDRHFAVHETLDDALAARVA